MTRVIFNLQAPRQLVVAAVTPGRSATLMEDGSALSELLGEGLLASSGMLQIYYEASTLSPAHLKHLCSPANKQYQLNLDTFTLIPKRDCFA